MTKIKRVSRVSKSSVPENWVDCVFHVWEEDDATMRQLDHMTPAHFAFRMLGIGPKELLSMKVASHDEGDSFYNLYSNGLVIAYICDGGFVGFLYEVVN